MLRLTALATAAVLVPAADAAAGFPAAGAIDLRTRANVEVLGARPLDSAASTIAPAGDVNGDGVDDVLVGAPDADRGARKAAGVAYVVFGRRAGAQGGGFRILGPNAGARAGESVAAAGDLNGDGFDDVVLGAPGTGRKLRPRGAVYVVFGAERGANVDLARLGDRGLTLLGERHGARLGRSVAGGRDVDGDRRPDVVAASGAWEHDVPGAAVVIRGGRRRGRIARPDLTLRGDVGRVALTGDMNGDGRAELVAGAIRTPRTQGTTLARVVFGRRTSGAVAVAAGFTVTGTVGQGAPPLFADAGDVDGDGRGDLVTGFANGATVIFGAATAEPVAALAPGARGIVVRGGGLFGAAVAGAGDLDGDGLDDLLVGAPTTAATGRVAAGAAFLVYGSRTPAERFLGDPALRVLRFDGEQVGDNLGGSVAGGGDFNDDGRRDVLLGGPWASRGKRAVGGVAYVVYGR